MDYSGDLDGRFFVETESSDSQRIEKEDDLAVSAEQRSRP
jgi:hypothetical protein